MSSLKLILSLSVLLTLALLTCSHLTNALTVLISYAHNSMHSTMPNNIEVDPSFLMQPVLFMLAFTNLLALDSSLSFVSDTLDRKTHKCMSSKPDMMQFYCTSGSPGCLLDRSASLPPSRYQSPSCYSAGYR